jgi:hypothetical protein
MLSIFTSAYFATGAPDFRVDVDFSTRIQYRMGNMEKDHLERDIYFRSYGTLGNHSAARNNELREIGAPPGRGTVFQNLQSNADGQSFTAASENDALIGSYQRLTSIAQYNQDGIPNAVALSRYPDWMIVGNPQDPGGLLEDWEQQGGSKILRKDLYTPHAEFLAWKYEELQDMGSSVSLPTYYSPMNEPPWRWDRGDLADYHVAVANAFHARGVNVAVAGPCAAWPFPQSDFRTWNNTYRRFVEKAGGALDAYDFHFYSKGNWSLPPEPQWQEQRVPEPSLFEAQRLGIETVWDYGRLDGYLDLLSASHRAYWPERPFLPVVITEFGRQGIHPQFGPWENDFKPWLYMTTVIRQWMVYWHRPEVRLTIPFIMSMAGRNDAQSRGQAIFNQPNYPESTDYHPTRFYEFYQFFRDLSGDYAYVRATPRSHREDEVRDIRTAAFRDGNVGYLVLHNARGYPYHPVEVDVRQATPAGMGQPVIEWKRLYYEGEIPEPDSTAPLNGTLNIELDYQPLAEGTVMLPGEATAVIRYTWPSTVNVVNDRVVERHLSTDTMIDLEGYDAVSFVVELPESIDAVVDAQVEIGLARDGGFSIGPCVLVNGHRVGQLSVRSSRGVKDWHAVLALDVDPSVLNPGYNVIELQFEGFFRYGHPKAVSAAVITVE